MPTKIKAPTEGKLHPSVLGTWLTAPASGLKSTLKGQLRVPQTDVSFGTSQILAWWPGGLQPCVWGSDSHQHLEETLLPGCTEQ